MQTPITAFEITGTIDKNRQLQLDNPLPFAGPRRVRVIVLAEESDDIPEMLWDKAAAQHPDWQFLADPREDIYTIEDGKPIYDAV